MASFMEGFNTELAEAGELVETRALAAPVHTRRLGARDGSPFVTDGPYAETQEVLAWLLDRGMRQLRSSDRDRRPPGWLPGTGRMSRANAYADVRPIMETADEISVLIQQSQWPDG